MEDKKLSTEPIDIPPKNNEKNVKLKESPSSGWAWPWGKPPEKKLDLTPENVKSQVTDPNVLHHIAVGERQQQLKREREESEECQQDTEDEDVDETDEVSNDFEESEKKMTHCEKLEEYGEEIGYAMHEFKRSVELDLKHVYDDIMDAPQHAKLLFGAGLSIYLDFFPQAAVAFLTIMTVNGIIEAEVDKRLRQHIRKSVLVEDKNVCASLDDVDSDSEKCVDCDGEEKECV
tara:strand:- start:28 stop:723 length:696 start_codon:yes stop_codon:yes gene_type:complete